MLDYCVGLQPDSDSLKEHDLYLLIHLHHFDVTFMLSIRKIKTYYSFSIVYLSPLFTPGESELSGLFSTTIHVNTTKKMPVKVLFF